MGLLATLKVAWTATLSAVVGHATSTAPVAYSPTYLFPTGTGHYQATTQHSDSRTLTAGSSEVIDLQILTDKLGNAIVMTSLKALIIRSETTNVGDIVFGPDASNGFVAPFGAANDRVRIKPGGIAVFIAPDATGFAVSATTKRLFIENTGAVSNNYAILLVGVG